MSKKLQLHIPLPCHEDWDNMTRVEKGKFCASCNKAVIDFTEMSDEQVITFFKRPSTGSVCGRFQENQLNRNMQMPRRTLPWIKYFFQFTLPAFLISMKVDAQREKTGKIVPVCINEIKNDREFKVPDTIPIVASTQNAMILQQSIQGIAGGVVVGVRILTHRKKREMREAKVTYIIRSLKDSIIAPFAKFSVYPNPVISGQSITIANNKLADDNYSIEIINLAGQIVHQERLLISGKQKINLKTPFVAAGTYFLKLTGEKSIKTYSEKIIVQ